jgi:outer membrane protein TolC
MSFSQSKFVPPPVLMTSIPLPMPVRALPSRSPSRFQTGSPIRLVTLIASFVWLTVSANAQISLTTAVDLALRNSPRVRMAMADVDKARATLSEVHDVYIPSIVGGAGLGYSYGVPITPPSVFNIAAQSLAFNYSQRDYLRAASAGLDAANLALMNVRQQIAEDATVTYIGLDYDIERLTVITTQQEYAAKLTQIIAARLEAGQDSRIDLTRSRRTSAQLKLQRLQIEEQLDTHRQHLARLIGLPAEGLTTIRSSVPEAPHTFSAPSEYLTPGVRAAYATARVKLEQAFGDARKLRRPEVYFVAQYNRLSTFNNVGQYYIAYNPNSAAIGVQISFTAINAVFGDKARESMADAVHARHEADLFRDQAAEGQFKLRHVNDELSARVELATIDRELAEDQLEVLLVQLQSGVSGGSAPLMTPKDEQNARMQERQRYLDLLDANFQLRQIQINQLRQSGRLEDWLKSAAQSQPVGPVPASK